MMKYLWAGMIVIGMAVCMATGKLEALSDTLLSSAQQAAELGFSMLGIYTLWMGLLNIATDSGLVAAIARRAQRLMRMLFRGLERGSDAIAYITLNMVANMLGMGNAATPFGLKAMAALKQVSPEKDASRASHDMCMFIIINTASVQILPLSIIAVRAAAGSANPAEIVITAFLATLATAVFGVIGAKICARGRA